MIFDSQKMKELRASYVNEPDYAVPEIVEMDRSLRLSSERGVLEHSIELVPDEQKQRLLGILFSEERPQYLGAWFELMLGDWLRASHVGHVEVEPSVSTAQPDFQITDSDGNLIVIEALSIARKPWEELQHRRTQELHSALRSIENSYVVKVSIQASVESFDGQKFRSDVSSFLEYSTDQFFDYQDEYGNRILLEAVPHPTTDRLLCIMSHPTVSVSPDPLKGKLTKKAQQHFSALSGQSIPYVLAVYLDSVYLSAEEIQEAWGGRPSVIVDTQSGEIVQETVDGTGLHYKKGDVRYRNVSGTLVFKSRYDAAAKRRFLDSWYVQNPHADIPIDSSTFPAQSRFVVVGKDDRNYQMNWLHE